MFLSKPFQSIEVIVRYLPWSVDARDPGRLRIRGLERAAVFGSGGEPRTCLSVLQNIQKVRLE